MAALLPFGKVADFLGELLPLSSKTTPSTVRNRTMNVGRQLQESAAVLASSSSNEPAKELVVGLDGGYVGNRHQRPERNFEVIAGKALDREGHATRFAFVRNGGSEAMAKKQQMRWNRHTVQSFLDIRVHVLNGRLENAFRH
jgi:hypothetical protein